MIQSVFAIVLAVLGAVQASPVLEERQTTTTYDYIVVGGGAAGLVTADRLSAAGKRTILLERGPPTSYVNGGRNGPAWALENGLTRYDVPGLCNQIWMDSIGIACTDMDQMAGCVLGGGTAVNAGLFFKPPSQDWDLNFPTGWKSTDMVSATNKVFTRIPSTDTPSQDGQRYLQESYTALSGILKTAGWSEVTANSVPESKNRTFAHTPYMYANGERGGPLATYLQTSKARTTFTLAVNTTVNKVIRTGAQISGVSVSPFGDGGLNGTISLRSGGRVILAAGALGTPKILFRSGIGPTDSLTVVNNSATDGATFLPQASWILLPVGYNLMDHVNTDMVISHPSVVPYDFYAAYETPIEADADAYLNSRAGPLAAAAPAPNTMLWESFTGASDGIVRQVQWTARVEGSLGFTGDNLVTISQYLGTGMSSRGRISIRTNLNTAVTVTPYAKTADDVAAIVKGIASLQSALAADPNVTFLAPEPGMTAAAYVAQYFSSRRANHWMGSAKLGTVDGRTWGGVNGSVVDTNTKVYGTNNLYVVDASIFPGHVTGNPSAAIMIAAERAVERILAS